MPSANSLISPGIPRSRQPFEIAASDFFSRRIEGDLGAWCYADPEYKGDPAGGAVLWEEFLASSPDYYLFNEDRLLISKSAKTLRRQIGRSETVIEFGPGDSKAVTANTLPLLNALGTSNYVPVFPRFSRSVPVFPVFPVFFPVSFRSRFPSGFPFRKICRAVYF
jgi:hypothetical protein